MTWVTGIALAVLLLIVLAQGRMISRLADNTLKLAELLENTVKITGTHVGQIDQRLKRLEARDGGRWS